MDEQRLLSIREVASALGVSEVTVRRRIETGELGAVQLGGKGTALRVPASELEEFVFREPEDGVA